MNTLLTPKRWVPAAIVVAVVLALASPAFAHVEITSGDAQAGSPSTISVTVPNERDDASTVKVELVYPDGQVLTDVTVAETAGWTSAVSADRITWTGGPLTGTDEVTFTFVGTVPAGATSLEFRALQTYDDGTVVRWIEPTPAGGPEPDHPAPVLVIGTPAADHHAEEGSDATATTGAHDDSEGADTGDEAESDNDSESSSDGTVIAVVVIAIVVLAAGAGGFIYMRRRNAS